jgi:hypothetical protein
MDIRRIQHDLRGKMNSLQLSTAVIPVLDPDEALVFVEHVTRQTEQIIKLLDDLDAIQAKDQQPMQ